MIAKAFLHFRNDKGNGAKMCPFFVSGIFSWGSAGQLAAIISPVPSNSPRTVGTVAS